MQLPTVLRALLVLILPAVVLADSTTSSVVSQTATSEPTSTPSIAYRYDWDSNWIFQGCWNETTMLNITGNMRALSGGTVLSEEDMTVQLCLDHCWSDGISTYAGLEYAKECYCSTSLNAYSERLPETACDLPCAADSSQTCGGHLTLSVYRMRVNTAGTRIISGGTKTRASPVGSLLAFGIAMGGLLGMV